MNQQAMQPKRANQPTFFDLAVQQRGRTKANQAWLRAHGMPP